MKAISIKQPWAGSMAILQKIGGYSQKTYNYENFNN